MGKSSGSELIRALSHPLRRQILREMVDMDSMSPRQVAEALDLPLSILSYHVRVLARCRAIEMVDTQQVRGALAHFYRFDIEEPWALAALTFDGQSSDFGSNPKS